MTLQQLIDQVLDRYALGDSPLGRRAALQDPNGLAALGSCIPMCDRLISVEDFEEVAKWGKNWGASRYPELHQYAPNPVHLRELAAQG